jgi:hypothetical protein
MDLASEDHSHEEPGIGGSRGGLGGTTGLVGGGLMSPFRKSIDRWPSWKWPDWLERWCKGFWPEEVDIASEVILRLRRFAGWRVVDWRSGIVATESTSRKVRVCDEIQDLGRDSDGNGERSSGTY